MVARRPFGVEVDVWSLGVFLFVALTKTWPFEPHTADNHPGYALTFIPSVWGTFSDECVVGANGGQG